MFVFGFVFKINDAFVISCKQWKNGWLHFSGEICLIRNWRCQLIIEQKVFTTNFQNILKSINIILVCLVLLFKDKWRSSVSHSELFTSCIFDLMKSLNFGFYRFWKKKRFFYKNWLLLVGLYYWVFVIFFKKKKIVL